MSHPGALGLDVDDNGVFLRALGLWLDPPRAAAAAFLSHAHAAAGAKQSGRVLASPETIALARAIDRGLDGAQPIGWQESIEMPIDRRFGGQTARLSIAPAGHVLGAAQLVVDHPRGRLVYTGDWSNDLDATHATGIPVPCDELIVTSTFGLPIFRFGPHAETLAAIVAWCAARVADKKGPTVLAQTPGRAQSIARALLVSGVPVVAQDDVARDCGVYESLGVPIGPLRPSTSDDRTAVLIAPVGGSSKGRRLRAPIAYASGWALLDAAVEQKRADAAFALADQADHDGLMALVSATRARTVHVTRGDARALAHVLRGQGLDAHALELPPIDGRGAS